MRHQIVQLPARMVVAAAIVAMSAACADDPATRIERARDHQANDEYRAAIIELKNVLREDTGNTTARAMLGEVALLNGDSTTAIKELRRAQELGANADLYTVPLARALMREGLFLEASRINPDSVTDVTKRAAVLALVGAAELQLDNTQAAQEYFDAALALDPNQPDAMIGRAKLASSRGDMSTAKSALESVLQSTPGNADGLAELARLQQLQGDFASAEKNLNKALESIEGTNRAQERMQYLSSLADVLIAQDKTDEAVVVGAKMMAISDKHPMSLFQSARAEFAAGRFDDVIDKAGRLITMFPTAEPPRMLLVAAALSKRDAALAATHLQIAVDNNPSNETARMLLARVRLDQGDPQEALTLLEPMVSAGTNNPELLAIAGAANLGSGNTETGVEMIERGLEVGVDDPGLVLSLAANFMAAGEIDRAVSVLESLPESERVGQRELMLVLASLKKGDQDGARARAQAAVKAQPESSEAHRLLGSFHMAVKEFDKARSEFQKSLELNPNDLGTVVNIARLDVAENKPEKAKARFEAMLESHPGSLLALTALAELRESAGDREGAVELIEQAAKANPDAIDPLLRLTRYYLREGQLPIAEERANQIIRAHPSNADGYSLLGQVLMADGRYSEAMGHLEKALELAPREPVPNYHYARVLAATGQDERSFEAFKKTVELSKDFFPARVALTEAAVRRGDFRLALATTDSLIADYPDRVEPVLLKASVQKASNDFGGALRTYQAAYEIRPTRDLAANIFKVRKAMGDKEPWEELKQWVSDHPGDTEAQSMLGAAYFDGGLKDLAVESFEQVMEKAPVVRVAMTLAEIKRSGGELDAAARWLQQAVDLAPAEMPARSALATVELQRGNTDDAVKLLRELREDFPNAPELNVLEGDVYLAQGNHRKSIEAYEKAFSAAPSEFLLLKRYQALHQSGDGDAYKALESWFADHPGHIHTGLQLAQAYSEREWHDQAIDMYEKVLKATPDNAFALNNVAWAYLERGNDGDIRRALAASSKAYEMEPNYAAIADTFGWILLQDGQNKRATEILAKASAQDGSSPEIKYHHAVALDAIGKDTEALALLNDLLANNAAFEGRDDAEVLQRRLSP